MSAPGHIKAAVFDLDGTLIDSAPDLHATANKLMAEMQLPEINLEIITSFIGNGIPMLVRRALEHNKASTEAEAFDKAVKRFMAIYAQAPAENTIVYPGVLEAMKAFRAAGVRLGVCTNKAESLSRAVLDELGLAEFFEVVIGGDTLSTRKPDPTGLLQAVGQLGADTHSALYIGDSEVDAETAKKADLRFALFKRGYRKAPISELRHWQSFDDMRELTASIGLSEVVQAG